MSRGTETPARRRPRRTPTAAVSLAQMIAVGSGRIARMWSTAAAVLSAAAGACRISNSTSAGSRPVATHARLLEELQALVLPCQLHVGAEQQLHAARLDEPVLDRAGHLGEERVRRVEHDGAHDGARRTAQLTGRPVADELHPLHGLLDA